MNKKQKNAKLPGYRLNAKAKNAAGAAATAGRSRTFADKQDKLAKQSADPEIAEGYAEYETKLVEKVAAEKRAKLDAKKPGIDGTETIQINIVVNLTKMKCSREDAVSQIRHWIEVDTTWPDYIETVQVKENKPLEERL